MNDFELYSVYPREDPIDDRFEIFKLTTNEFLVFDIFEHLPRDYWKKEGLIDIPDEFSKYGIIVFNGNYDDSFYNKSPRQVFLSQCNPLLDEKLPNAVELHRGCCLVLNPPFVLAMKREDIERFFHKGVLFDFSMS